MIRGANARNGQIGLRERKKLHTRQALEDAALRLFAEKGFDQVSIEEIADEVGVSSRTFFRYFGSKEDLIFGLMLDAQRVLEAALAERPADEPVLESLRHGITRLAEHLEVLRPQLVGRFQIARNTPALAPRGAQLRDEWRALLVDMVARRLGTDPTTDLRPHVAAAWAIAGLSAAREIWDLGATGRDLPSLLGEAYELLSSDLAASLASGAPGA